MDDQVEPLSSTATALRRGDRDPASYADHLLDRIEARDMNVRAFQCESGCRARITEAAGKLVDRFDAGDQLPLYGVPVGIKDIIHVDGFETRAGSALPPELFAGEEAAVVRALRDAGALVLGKTATTEFAGEAPTLTRNPVDLEHTPGGSSSGSAAAVAAGMAPLAVGSQTGGSVIRPAAFCGIIGFKPSHDRLPTDGVVPRSPSIDHVGLFTGDMEGMARAASAVCVDLEPVDPPTADDAVLGVPTGPYLDQAEPAGRAAFDNQVDALAAAGYKFRHVDPFADFERLRTRYWDLTIGELGRVHEDWIEPYKDFYRVPTATRVRTGLEIPDDRIEAGLPYADEARAGVHEAMDDAGIDCWVCPAAPGPAPAGITNTGDPKMNYPWTFVGLPAVTVPAGTVNGLPVGLQCVGRFGADAALLARGARIAEVLP